MFIYGIPCSDMFNLIRTNKLSKIELYDGYPYFIMIKDDGEYYSWPGICDELNEYYENLYKGILTSVKI